MRFLLLFFFLSISLTVFSQEQNYVTNEVLVRFEPKTDVSSFVKHFSASETITFTDSKLISPHLNIWHLKYDGNMEAPRLVKELWEQSAVSVVQVNHKIQQRITPNDPLYNQQWQWDNIDAGGAWDVTTGGVTANGDTIVVAVIDDGIQLDHPDLQANIWHNYAEIPGNGIDDDNNGFVDDFNGWNIDFDNNNVDVGDHGINCSGMVGAVGNDGNQGVGANWNVKIMTVVGGGGVAQEAAIIEAYSYVLDFRKRYNESNGAEGAFVVATNSSWGSDFTQASEAPLWCAFFDSLGVEGILSCGATSNSAYDVDQQGDLPTACSSDYLISVTATDVNDSRNFSAWGLETIDVAAPGDNIYTTSQGGGYTTTSGTSFATPLTAGLVGLLYSAPCSDIADLSSSNPAAAALLVKSYILDGVDKTDQLMGEIKSGGRVNANKSMQLLMGGCGACIPPFSVATVDVTDQEASLTFASLNDGVNLTVTTGGNTTDYTDITSPFLLNNLTGCTEYVLGLQSVCADSLSEVANYTFMTDGCCDIPDSFQVASVEKGAVSLKWESVLAAVSYTIEYAPEPYTNWASVTTTDLTTSILGLAECTKYQFRIRTDCNGPEIPFGEPITAKTTGCGACLDLTYCEVSTNSNSDEWIDSLLIEGVFENISGAEPNNAYGLFSDIDFSLQKGETYSLTLVPGYGGTIYSENVRIWIDYNQDGIFQEEETVLNPDFTINEASTFDITIDPDALSGYTRMRVYLSFSSVGTACDIPSFGEIEDYCVTIKEAGYCLGPDTLIIDDLNYYSFNLDWDDVEDDISYVVKHRLVGGDWNEVSTVTSDYQFGNLEECSEYEVEVQAICMEGIGQKVNQTIKTKCLTGTTTPFGENAFTIQPNPFTNNFDIMVHGVSTDKYQVRLFDLLGRTIAIQTNTGAQSMTITPITPLEKGVYLLQLKTDTHAGVVKVVKQ